MRSVIVAISALLLAAPVLAGTAPTPPIPAVAPAPPPGGAAVTPDGRVAISREACVGVMTQAREGADYVPGVDVNGKPVAPADLPPDESPPGPIFAIVLDVQLRQGFHIPGNATLFRPHAEVGVITVQGSIVLFNGQPLAATETALLVAECRAHGFAPK